MADKLDRRVRKTRTQLKQGLAKLMQAKNINEITVKELVEAVDINRSTFYLHYSDIYNLMEEIENEVLMEIQNIIKEHPMGVENNTFTFMEAIFFVMDDNRDICRALLGDSGDATFIYKIRQIIQDNSMQLLESLFPDIKEKLHYKFSFCMSGCMGIVNEWLYKDKPETPQEIAKLAFQMVMHALDIDKYEDIIFEDTTDKVNKTLEE